MSSQVSRVVVVALLLGTVLTAGVAPAVAAPGTQVVDPGKHARTDVAVGAALVSLPTGSAEVQETTAAATSVRKAFLKAKKAFLKAKKAFHEGREDLQAIKKGEADPASEVPTFFDGDGDAGEGDQEEDCGDGCLQA